MSLGEYTGGPGALPRSVQAPLPTTKRPAGVGEAGAGAALRVLLLERAGGRGQLVGGGAQAAVSSIMMDNHETVADYMWLQH